MKSFYLMNKDTPVLQFTINDVLGVSSINIDKGFTKVVPLSFKGMVSFNKWIEDRLVLSHRRNIFSLLQSEGITKIEDIISCTNCISLLDSFWVREVNSNLSWKSVSPYKNPLNERISRFSYDGSIVNGKKITGSPDFSTGGSFPKCWKKVDGSIYLYKSGSNIAYNSGREPYSEYLTSKLAQKLFPNECVKYDLVEYKNKVATRCKNICTESIGMSSVADISPDIKNFNDLLKYNYGGKRDLIRLVNMLLLDFLSLNVDRHLNNIGVLIHNETQRMLGIAPIYDFNLAFLPYYTDNLDGTIEDYINRKDNDAYLYANDGTPFEDIIKMLSDLGYGKYIHNTLNTLRGFKFSKSINRYEIANRVLQRQIKIAYSLI